MFQPPSLRRVVALAESAGMHLGDSEAEHYYAAVVEQLEQLHEFLQSEFDIEHPPIRFPERQLGYRPSAEENRYRAWLWKCRIGGSHEGLLAGRTVGFKDHISVAGINQHFTSLPMSGFVPDVDATVVTRTLDAGATVVGKTMMSGFMDDFGNPVNPHNSGHVAGTSSSGSAVAVAAGEADLTFGGDQGGSVRVPAAYCGVLGLKPTFSLVSHFGATFGTEPSVDHVGPMARSVEDIAAALDAVAGRDDLDPRQGPDVPARVDTLSTLERGVADLRVGILAEGFDAPVDPDVRDGVLRALDVLAGEGAVLSSVSVPEHRLVNAVYPALTIEGARAVMDTGFHPIGATTYYPASVITALDRLWHEGADRFLPRVKINYLVAALSRQAYRGAVYAKAHNVRPTLIRAYDRALAEVDVLAMPTVRDTAPAIAPAAEGPDAIEQRVRAGNWMAAPYTYNTKPADLTGHPALALPCGKVRGLPISLQLVGRRFDDATVLRVAYAYQQAVDWAGITRVES